MLQQQSRRKRTRLARHAHPTIGLPLPGVVRPNPLRGAHRPVVDPRHRAIECATGNKDDLRHPVVSADLPWPKGFNINGKYCTGCHSGWGGVDCGHRYQACDALDPHAPACFTRGSCYGASTGKYEHTCNCRSEGATGCGTWETSSGTSRRSGATRRCSVRREESAQGRWTSMGEGRGPDKRRCEVSCGSAHVIHSTS